MAFIWAFLIGFVTAIIFAIFVAVYKMNQQKQYAKSLFDDMEKNTQELINKQNQSQPKNENEETDKDESRWIL